MHDMREANRGAPRTQGTAAVGLRTRKAAARGGDVVRATRVAAGANDQLATSTAVNVGFISWLGIAM